MNARKWIILYDQRQSNKKQPTYKEGEKNKVIAIIIIFECELNKIIAINISE